MKSSLFSLLAAVLLLVSCAKKTTPTVDAATPLAGTYWKLVELNGQPFATSGKPAFLLLQADGKFSGSAGCNTILGGYETQNNFNLQFKSNMASTMMACPNQATEDAFKQMLADVNNYAIAGDKLSLSKNRMAPAARFEKSVQPK